MIEWRIDTVAETSSTMDHARAQIQQGAVAYAGVRAVRQTNGRGRRGRAWTSLPGNLYFSFILPVDEGGLMPLSMGLALSDALRPLIPAEVPIQLKWPNDVLVDGRKIAGILIEREGEFAIVGIGVNIVDAPEERAYLGEWNSMSVEAFLPLFLKSIGEALESDPVDVAQRWNKNAAWKGEEITFQHGGNTVMGTFQGVDEHGHALLREGMETKAYASGEVMEVRAA